MGVHPETPPRAEAKCPVWSPGLNPSLTHRRSQALVPGWLSPHQPLCSQRKGHCEIFLWYIPLHDFSCWSKATKPFLPLSISKKYGHFLGHGRPHWWGFTPHPSPLFSSHLQPPGSRRGRRGRAGTGSSWLTPGPGLHGAAVGTHQGNKGMGDLRWCRSLGTVVYRTADVLS